MKKAQAAMEFLMTYGWAILVVLGAVGALAYFGVLSPEGHIPEKCTIEPGIACTDYAYIDGELQLLIQNAGGYDLMNVSVSVTDNLNCNPDPVIGSKYNGKLNNGQGDSFVFDLNSCNYDEDSKFKADIIMTYYKRSGLKHIAKGEVIAKVR